MKVAKAATQEESRGKSLLQVAKAATQSKQKKAEANR
jgi:hypothetical protein